MKKLEEYRETGPQHNLLHNALKQSPTSVPRSKAVIENGGDVLPPHLISLSFGFPHELLR